MDLAFETAKVVQGAAVEIAKANANTTTTIKKDFSFLGLDF